MISFPSSVNGLIAPRSRFHHILFYFGRLRCQVRADALCYARLPHTLHRSPLTNGPATAKAAPMPSKHGPMASCELTANMVAVCANCRG